MLRRVNGLKITQNAPISLNLKTSSGPLWTLRPPLNLSCLCSLAISANGFGIRRDWREVNDKLSIVLPKSTMSGTRHIVLSKGRRNFWKLLKKKLLKKVSQVLHSGRGLIFTPHWWRWWEPSPGQARLWPEQNNSVLNWSWSWDDIHTCPSGVVCTLAVLEGKSVFPSKVQGHSSLEKLTSTPQWKTPLLLP